jgi:integrase
MGCIYKRGRIYWIKYYRNGKPYCESSKSKKEADARRLLKKREGEIAVGKLPGIYFDKVRLDELAQDFLSDYRINQKKSFKRAERSVNHLKEMFEGLRVVDITTPLINRYIEKRLSWTCRQCKEIIEPQDNCPHCGSEQIMRGAAPATINRELAALKRMFNLGAQQTPPKVDRVPYIPMLKEDNVRKGFFEHDDFLALRDALPSYLKGFVTFAYKTGWRASEIQSLTWRQVDLSQGIVRLEVGETKNKEGRTVYLDAELRQIFEQQYESRKRQKKLIPFVFPNKEGDDKINEFRGIWNRACRDAGLGYGYKPSKKYVEKWKDKLPSGPILHDFRRTAVRNMIRSGIPERVAMMISGHKTRSVFDRYNIVSDSDLKMAARLQEEYLKSATVTKTVTIVDFEEKKESSTTLDNSD